MCMKKLYLLSILFIVSCATTTEEYNYYWVGSDVNDLIFEYGVPDNTIELDDGRSILNYKFNQTSQSTDNDGNLSTTNIYCTGSVFADANNKIVKIDFKGNFGGCNNLKNKILILDLD